MAGWTVEFNNFFECNPEDCEDFWSIFNEDLLQLKNNKFDLTIDLGWCPDGDPNGKYILYFIIHGNWRNPLEVFESRSTKDIVDKIELCTNYGYFNKYI
jgi:hypothetical protein